MDPSRSERIASVMKDITGLGRAIKKPTTLRYIPAGQSRLSEPLGGTQVVRILMIGVASLLLIGVILLCIDQWVTPIFQRAPGDGGYIPVPGIDPSEIFWLSSQTINDVKVGILSPTSSPATPSGYTVLGLQTPPTATTTLSTSVIENQANYSITMDVMITDEYPQTLGSDSSGNPIIHRTFFLLGPSLNIPTLKVSLDNLTNTCIITIFDSNRTVQSIEIDNVPIHKSFRIGISLSPYIMEGYLNGLLVKTRQLRVSTLLPQAGDTLFAPANIKINNNLVSDGIKIRNLRTFGYTVSSSEMKGRMNDGLLNSSGW